MDNTLIKKATECHRRGQLQEAIKLYQRILDENPQQADVLHHLAVALSQSGDNESALQYITQALILDLKNASYHNSHGNILLKLNQHEQALNTFQIAIKLAPEHAAAYINQGRCYFYLDDLEHAADSYQQALRLDPKSSNAYMNLALIYLKQDNHEAAEKSLRQAIKFNPHHPQAHSQLGHILLKQRHFKEAIKHFIKKLESHPLDTETLHSLGLAYLKDGQIAEAIQFLEQCLKTQSNHPDVNYDLATAYVMQGDPLKALNYYLRQNEIQPSHTCYYNIGVLLMYQERNKEAVDYLQQSLKMDPKHTATLINLGAIYLKGEQFDKALTYYQRALTIKPNDKEIAHIIAALDSNQNPKQAPQEYLSHLFDNYAVHYDQHLVEHLKFQVPQRIKKVLYEETGIDTPSWKILDLGCGTGLSGEAIKSVSLELIGIDASQKMLERATQKKIYDQLIHGNISECIKNFKGIDLVVASDVFTYIGDLDALFKNISMVLKPGGLLIFSVEQGFESNYTLQTNIRYCHKKSYIEHCLKDHALNIERCDNIILREQKKKAVLGYLFLAKKTLL